MRGFFKLLLVLSVAIEFQAHAETPDKIPLDQMPKLKINDPTSFENGLDFFKRLFIRRQRQEEGNTPQNNFPNISCFFELSKAEKEFHFSTYTIQAPRDPVNYVTLNDLFFSSAFNNNNMTGFAKLVDERFVSNVDLLVTNRDGLESDVMNWFQQRFVALVFRQVYDQETFVITHLIYFNDGAKKHIGFYKSISSGIEEPRLGTHYSTGVVKMFESFKDPLLVHDCK